MSPKHVDRISAKQSDRSQDVQGTLDQVFNFIVLSELLASRLSLEEYV